MTAKVPTAITANPFSAVMIFSFKWNPCCTWILWAAFFTGCDVETERARGRKNNMMRSRWLVRRAWWWRGCSDAITVDGYCICSSEIECGSCWGGGRYLFEACSDGWEAWYQLSHPARTPFSKKAVTEGLHFHNSWSVHQPRAWQHDLCSLEYGKHLRQKFYIFMWATDPIVTCYNWCLSVQVQYQPIFKSLYIFTTTVNC